MRSERTVSCAKAPLAHTSSSSTIADKIQRAAPIMRRLMHTGVARTEWVLTMKESTLVVE